MNILKEIHVEFEEALLIDWVLTMHTFDLSQFDRLVQDDLLALRKANGAIVVGKEPTNLNLTPPQFEFLLIVVPITFRFYEKDIGFSLKTKLLTALQPPRINFGYAQVVEVEPNANNNSTSPNQAQDTPKDSPDSSEGTFSS